MRRLLLSVIDQLMHDLMHEVGTGRALDNARHEIDEPIGSRSQHLRNTALLSGNEKDVGGFRESNRRDNKRRAAMAYTGKTDFHMP